MTFSLIKLTDKHMTRQQIGMPREAHFFPSEASAVWVDKHDITRVAGNCQRKSYLRYIGMTPSGEDSPYTKWIFALGKAVEEILIEQWKQMGLWIGNNIKFYDPIRNVSGELDCVLVEPDGKTLFGVEVKSFYGYEANRDLCGNKSIVGSPKTSQLMQTLIYVDQCKSFISYFKMVYYSRDSANRVEFDITLTKDGDVTRPTVNGIIDYRFTLEDIYNRYDELQAHVVNKIIPEPDFELVWSDEKVEQRKLLGEVSKTKYEAWQKGKEKIGDWQCRFCPYKDACWPKS
jgi:hypothetical protein